MIAATQSNHPLAGVIAPGNSSPLETATARMRENGLRVTKPRMALIEVLSRQSGPIPIERLHQAVSREACDLVTVYRCLGAFEQIGLVRRSFLHNGTSLYELTLGAAPQHYHLVCKSCGKTERVDYFPIEGAERLVRERGYSQVSHLVEFFGICPSCQTAFPARQNMPPPAR